MSHMNNVTLVVDPIGPNLIYQTRLQSGVVLVKDVKTVTSAFVQD